MSESKEAFKLEKSERLQKLKVLLAEDNEINQLLAKGILNHWGAETKVAETGDEVLDLLRREDFDLVLMDIQMPEKSGIEAANEIRQLADKRKKNIPIIALTANALRGEEIKYKAAGMDDFLTKPFRETDLLEVINRVFDQKGLFGRELFTTETDMEKDKLEEPEELYNLKQLEEIAAGSRDFLASLAEIYLTTVPANSSEMVEACGKAEWDKVSKLAHKLKSTVDSMNMETIRKDIRTLEIDAKNKVNTQALPTIAAKVDSVIKKVALQLKEEFSLS